MGNIIAIIFDCICLFVFYLCIFNVLTGETSTSGNKVGGFIVITILMLLLIGNITYNIREIKERKKENKNVTN